jgi:DnaJ-class molecular chaperone
MNQIERILEIGKDKCLVERHCSPTGELINTEDLIVELNQTLDLLKAHQIAQQQGIVQKIEDCPSCNGTGHIPNDGVTHGKAVCDRCWGSGKINSITVTVT